MNLALKGILILNFHRLLYPIILSFLAFTFFVSDSGAKVKTVYKLLVTDYRGNRWIDYTAVDASTYVAYNGGVTFIKDVKVISHWKIKSDESLYGKSLINTKSWDQKIPQVKIESSSSVPLASKSSRSTVRKESTASPLYTKAAIVHRNRQRLELARHRSHQKAKEFDKFQSQNSTVISDLLKPHNQSQIELVESSIESRLSEDSRIDLAKSLVEDPFASQPSSTETLSSANKNFVRVKNKKSRPKKLTSVDEKSKREQKLNNKILARVNRYKNLIRSAARDNDLDPELLIALVYVESGGNSRAVSPKKASGLTQLMAGTAKDLGVTNVFDPRQNISGGARYLKQQMDSFGQISLALAAYNAGPTRVKTRNRLPSETQKYIKKVLQVKRALEAQ
ncbi:hypothetical protein CMK18_08960 [Candidatus Poribacteria bacterium]|nr:hypothetical protein [Candidatus Poribacteria bacterium]